MAAGSEVEVAGRADGRWASTLRRVRPARAGLPDRLRRVRPAGGGLPDRLRLVLASFLMLFVELALIRWTAANVIYLVHLTNFVLLASFLGIGLGFLRGGRRWDAFRLAPAALAVLVAFVLAFPVTVASLTARQPLAGALGMPPMPRWLSLTLIFAGTVLTMAAIAQETARLFTRFEPLEAYRLDVLGSLAGIAAFAGVSFLRLPPLAWALIVAATFAALLSDSEATASEHRRDAPRRESTTDGLAARGAERARSRAVQNGEATASEDRGDARPTNGDTGSTGARGAERASRLGGWQWAALAVLVLLLGAQTVLGAYHWSPYYKIRAIPAADNGLAIYVNNTPHQTAYPVAALHTRDPFYFLPYGKEPAPADVLVIGAGTGNDVAVALSEGAQRVDAVEIDPVLVDLGRAHHPDHPYQDPRVSVHVDDGRAFIERTHRRYDLIVLALPDSATIVTGQSALRLENYLFTTEALRRDRSLLKPTGTFAMYNYYEPWLLDRYAGTMQVAYGHPPCVQHMGAAGARQEAVLSIAADGTTPGCETVWARSSATLAPSTDDRPFPYLTQRTVPVFHRWMLGLILAASVLLVRLTAGRLRAMTPYADLAFMGAAFLLLETKNVVQFALLFGTTWVVNAAVFAGVLLSVLAAIETARRVRLPRPWLLYAGLLAALALAWLIPPAALLDLAVPLRFLAGIALAFAPIFLANLVFAQRFRSTPDPTVAFGANLLGAMVGGTLEYLALITGYRFLLILVAGLYGLAFLTGRRHLALAR